MTEADARKIKDPRTIPWNEPCFVFVAGRFYLGMWSIKIPPNPTFLLGGDITAQCWRYDETPDEWVLGVRFRKYYDKKIWESSDRKMWFAQKIQATKAEIETEVAELLTAIGCFTTNQTPVIESVLFNGDCEAAINTLTANPPDWCHMKVEP